MSIYPRIAFGLFDAGIKQDNDYYSVFGGYKSFCLPDDLKYDTANTRPIATYEPDYWLLDGSFRIKPDSGSLHIGILGSAMSDENGDFATDPVLTEHFSEAHDTDGLCLQFGSGSGDYCDEIVVRYYDGDDVLLSEETYNPTSATFSVENEVNGFEKITITFISTNRPYRYLRVTRIDYGYLLDMSGDSILSANIVEECDPISANLKYNTLDITLQSDDDDFNILNPQGYYAALKERQPVFIYENVDGVETFMGQFFLDEWESPTENTLVFRCIDLLGMLEKSQFSGKIYEGTTVETTLNNLLSQDGVRFSYELDADLEDVELEGYIAPCTYREFLQQLAFAIGASVECSRSSAVKIMPSKIADDESAVLTLTAEEIGLGRSVQLKDMVTGVEVSSHKYTETGTEKDLFKNTLAAGTYTIKFDEPCYGFSATGASINSYGSNRVTITVASEGEVTLTGTPYVDNVSIAEVETEETVTSQNVLAVEGATLVNPDNAATTAQRLYDYHQQRYVQKVKLFAPSIQIGDVVEVETIFEGKIKGVVEKMDVDLTGGFVVNAEIVGVVA